MPWMSQRSNCAHKRLLLNIRASCTLPGHRTTMFCISRFGPDTACTFTEKNPFRFLNSSAFSSPGMEFLSHFDILQIVPAKSSHTMKKVYKKIFIQIFLFTKLIHGIGNERKGHSIEICVSTHAPLHILLPHYGSQSIAFSGQLGC